MTHIIILKSSFESNHDAWCQYNAFYDNRYTLGDPVDMRGDVCSNRPGFIRVGILHTIRFPQAITDKELFRIYLNKELHHRKLDLSRIR
jgi:hypothetical protein